MDRLFAGASTIATVPILLVMLRFFPNLPAGNSHDVTLFVSRKVIVLPVGLIALCAIAFLVRKHRGEMTAA